MLSRINHKTNLISGIFCVLIAGFISVSVHRLAHQYQYWNAQKNPLEHQARKQGSNLRPDCLNCVLLSSMATQKPAAVYEHFTGNYEIRPQVNREFAEIISRPTRQSRAPPFYSVVSAG